MPLDLEKGIYVESYRYLMFLEQAISVSYKVKHIWDDFVFTFGAII